MRIQGGLFAIALPTGEFACLLPGDAILTHQGRVELPGLDVGYLDICRAPVFRIAGQAQVEPSDPRRGTWEWTAGQWVHVSQEAPGTYPVLYDSVGTLHIATPEHNGSQGWRYEGESGELVTGDDTLNGQRRVGQELGVSDMWEYSHFSGVTIGQGDPPPGCHVLIDGTRRLLEPGGAFFIRVRYGQGMWAVSMAKLEQRESVIHWLLRPQLLMLPLVEHSSQQPQPQPEPTPEPDNMTFPHSDLLQQFAAKFPLPQTPGGGEAHENKCREWCLMFAEQVAFSTGDLAWGVKRSAGPQSKDAIARDLAGGKMVVYDLMTGAGTGTPTLNLHPHGEEVHGQTFIPVIPQNYLGADDPQPQPQPEPQPGQVGPAQKHAYWRDDNERNECSVLLTTGQQCDQPREAAIHQHAPAPQPEPEPNPGPVPPTPGTGSQLDRIEAQLARLSFHLGLR